MGHWEYVSVDGLDVNRPDKSGTYKVKYKPSYTGAVTDTFKLDVHCGRCIQKWYRIILAWWVDA